MNFPRFWARGRSGDFFAWRWSMQSLAEAQSLADQAAGQLADRFRAGLLSPRRGGYYPDRPFREQVLQEIKNRAGEVTGVITRNSYGCRVLNTARVMFVDVDLPEPKKPGLFKKLFGKPDVSPPGHPQDEAMARIENWTRNHPDWGWRIYRTRSGLRLLATHALVDTDSEMARDVFDSLGADPLYRKLCCSQKCYRARLTPKPWRCGLHSRPERWPWLEPQQEKRFRKWELRYERCSAEWATCDFVRHIGHSTIHPEVQAVLSAHDEPTRAESKLRLA